MEEEEKPFQTVEQISVDTLKEKLGDRNWRLNNLYYVKNEKGEKVLFKLRPVQEYLLDNLWYFNIIPKARQLGMTTFFCILYLDQILFSKNKTAGIIAHKQEELKKIFRDKIKFAWNNLHPWLKQTIGDPNTDNANELIWTDAEGNTSTIFVSMSTRGGTVQFLHCVHPDMEIFMPDGYVKKISEIKEGEKIIDGNGGTQKVKQLLKQKTTEQMLDIKVSGYYKPLQVTEEHQVMTRTFKTGKPVWKKAKDIAKGDYIGFPIKEFHFRHKEEFNFELGRIMGLYLAEGSLRKKEITFSIDKDEVETVLEWLKPFKNEYNSHRIYYTKNSRTAVVVVNSWVRCEWIKENFGSGADKFISDAIFNYSSDFAKWVVYGYFYGDGHFGNRFEISVVGVRRQIIEQIRRLLISLRYGVSSVYYSPKRIKHGRNCKDIWTLKLMGAGNWKFRKEFNLDLPEYVTKSAKWRLANDRCPTERKFWRRGKDFYWTRVTGIIESENPEYVYDIVLDREPHSFLTVAGVVHNCSEFGYICQKFPEKAEEIVTGAINSVHAGCMVSIESTAKGREGYFYDFCMQADKIRKEGKELTEFDWKLFFFPWYLEESYSMPDATFVITSEDQKYFTELKNKHKIELTEAQKRWYVKKRNVNRDKMFMEFPSTLDEAFSVSVEGAYYAREMSKVYQTNRIQTIPVDPAIKVDTWWDLGVNDFMVIIFTQTVGATIRFVDLYYNHGEGLAHYVKVLEDKKYRYGKHIMPHDVNVKDMSSGITRKQQLYNLGMTDIVVAPKLGISDGIERVRSVFHRFYFDEEKTLKLYEALGNYRKDYDQKLGVYKDSPRHDDNSHFADCVRYGATMWREEANLGNDELNSEIKDETFFG